MSVEFKKISRDQSWRIFDRAAENLLGIDGETFASRWDAGEYADDSDTDVMQVAMLRPGGR
jgi:hypothetical protein